MSIYSLTSTSFQGEVFFEFDQSGNLVKFDTSGATLTEQQQLWLLREMPKHLAHVQRILGDSKTATLTEVKQVVTFEMFWNRYNYKDLSSKKKSRLRWFKMTVGQQIKAYNFIGRYELNLKPGTERKYAETYLNAELWNN